MSEFLAENWQFLILLFGFIALGWNITRSNRDMSLKVATKDDIARLEGKITSLSEELTNAKSRIDAHAKLIEATFDSFAQVQHGVKENSELLGQALVAIKNNMDNIDKLVGLFNRLLDKGR